MKQTLIIGDIHGCYAELQALLDAAGLSTGDEIIALGDIIDRGPASPAVLDFFRSQPLTRSLQGNHERKHVRAFRGALTAARSQVITRRQFGEASYPAAVEMMAGFPFSCDLPEVVLVHGFWEPGRALADQRENILVGTMSGEAYLKIHYREPWYAHYDGPKPLVMGHHNYTQSSQPLVYRDRVFGLDTGCCYGGALTGLLLPSFRLLSVPSRSDHWQALRQAYPLEAANHHAPDRWDAASLALLDRLAGWAAKEAARLWAVLRADPEAEGLSGRMLGRLYAEWVGERPGAALLHLASRHDLSRDSLQAALETPEAAWSVARQVGLADED